MILQARTVGGILMTLMHLVFAFHFIAMLMHRGGATEQPTLFRTVVKETPQ